jgi:hypothetical protein
VCRLLDAQDAKERKDMKTLREQVEAEVFGLTPGKIGRRYHAAAALPPSAWRRSLKPWAALVLGWFAGMVFAATVIVFWEVGT